ncbi:hypothetical protein SAMN05192560_1109 [Methylobacillus rhizosphaerae]|uniref:Uncharacterized protein n=1 Tax=Methylobacillus rhizosphaerae TaxID=551994 RepID=A0A238Z7D7_9PROT|nr:hypothetical protein SAMN05192560_1109 [Methylobacillus rhizosphaerae]
MAEFANSPVTYVKYTGLAMEFAESKSFFHFLKFHLGSKSIDSFDHQWKSTAV